MNESEQPISIRLPVTREQRRRYTRASGARKMKLLDWIYETLDSEANASMQIDPIDQSTRQNTDID